MPTALDLIFVPLAHDLVAKFGKPVTFTTTTTGTYNTTTGAATVTTSSVSVKAVINNPDVLEFANGLVVDGDVFATFAAADLGAPPKPGDTVIIDSITWITIGTKATFSGEQVAVYKVHLRQ